MKATSKWAQLTREQTSRIVMAANSAPNADNCQPWFFRYRHGILSILHDNDRAKHFLNHDRSLSRIGLGCLLQALEIGASLEGLQANVQLSLDDDANKPWASVRFTRHTNEPHPLTEAMFRRATDRRAFWKGKLPNATREEIKREAQKEPELGVYVLDKIAPEFVDYLLDCDAYILKHSAAMGEVAKFLRYTQKEKEEKRDGMPWQNMGLPIPEMRSLALSRFPAVHQAIERLQLHRFAQRFYRAALESAGALICITVRSMERPALVAGGRVGYLIWLHLTEIGWGVQPISFSCLPIYQRNAGHRAPTGHAQLDEISRIGKEIMPRHFGYPGNELPIWIFRTGLATPQPQGAKALRRKVEDILLFESD